MRKRENCCEQYLLFYSLRYICPIMEICHYPFRRPGTNLVSVTYNQKVKEWSKGGHWVRCFLHFLLGLFDPVVLVVIQGGFWVRHFLHFLLAPYKPAAIRKFMYQVYASGSQRPIPASHAYIFL